MFSPLEYDRLTHSGDSGIKRWKAVDMIGRYQKPGILERFGPDVRVVRLIPD
jgi:hypothetical protein